MQFLCSFLLNHRELALPALGICLDAFQWLDTEALSKVSLFCTTVVYTCIITNDAELCRFVCSALFSAILRSLEVEINSAISADLLDKIREILLYLNHRDSSSRTVSHPSVLSFLIPIQYFFYNCYWYTISYENG